MSELQKTKKSYANKRLKSDVLLAHQPGKKTDEPLKSSRYFNEQIVKPKDNISKVINYENG